MPATKDLTGQRFGIFTVEKRLFSHLGAWHWECLCDCGKRFIKASGLIKIAKSCGCLQRISPVLALGRELHGMSKTGAFKAWSSMKARCSERGQYRLLGITLCDRWQSSFLAFLADMGPRPSDYHSIDRIDNDKGYEPGNCRWATPNVQSNNRRCSIHLEMEGETKPLTTWCKELDLSRHSVWRLTKQGLPLAQIITQLRKEHVTVSVGRRSVSVPDAAKILGVTRSSAYRLLRQGQLQNRLLNHVGSRRHSDRRV